MAEMIGDIDFTKKELYIDGQEEQFVVTLRNPSGLPWDPTACLYQKSPAFPPLNINRKMNFLVGAVQSGQLTDIRFNFLVPSLLHMRLNEQPPVVES